MAVKVEQAVSGNWVRRLAGALVRLAGWRLEGPLPDAPKYVIILYPHTSNWDGLIGVTAGYAYGVLGGAWPHGFMIKIEWSQHPLAGWLVRALGGIGIDRSRSTDVVDQMVAEFARRDRLALAITPEGTRKAGKYWRSGFYSIALKAGVPIAPAFLDYRTKRAGLGPLVHLSGDVERDLNQIRAFYKDVQGKVPANQAPIRFRRGE
jgi:1-acyl-sn-glycerol-3-phosphate acyltransferase